LAVTLQSVFLGADEGARSFDIDFPVTSVSHLGSGNLGRQEDQYTNPKSGGVIVRMQKTEETDFEVVLNPHGLVTFDEPTRGIRLVYAEPNAGGTALIAYGNKAMALNRQGRIRLAGGGDDAFGTDCYWPVEHAPAAQVVAWEYGRVLAASEIVTVNFSPMPPYNPTGDGEGDILFGIKPKAWGRDGGRPKRLVFHAVLRSGAANMLRIHVKGKLSDDTGNYMNIQNKDLGLLALENIDTEEILPRMQLVCENRDAVSSIQIDYWAVLLGA